MSNNRFDRNFRSLRKNPTAPKGPRAHRIDRVVTIAFRVSSATPTKPVLCLPLSASLLPVAPLAVSVISTGIYTHNESTRQGQWHWHGALPLPDSTTPRPAPPHQFVQCRSSSKCRRRRGSGSGRGGGNSQPKGLRFWAAEIRGKTLAKTQNRRAIELAGREGRVDQAWQALALPRRPRIHPNKAAGAGAAACISLARDDNKKKNQSQTRRS